MMRTCRPRRRARCDRRAPRAPRARAPARCRRRCAAAPGRPGLSALPISSSWRTSGRRGSLAAEPRDDRVIVRQRGVVGKPARPCSNVSETAPASINSSTWPRAAAASPSRSLPARPAAASVRRCATAGARDRAAAPDDRACRTASAAERGRGVDEDVLADRLPPEQHARAHAFPVGQRHVDGPVAAADAHRRRDDEAVLARPVRTRHLAASDDGRRAGDLDVLPPRDRIDGKPHHARAGRPKASIWCACSADVFAPVSTFARIAGRPRSGSASHSSQPRMNVDVTTVTARDFAAPIMMFPPRLAPERRVPAGYRQDRRLTPLAGLPMSAPCRSCRSLHCPIRSCANLRPGGARRRRAAPPDRRHVRDDVRRAGVGLAAVQVRCRGGFSCSTSAAKTRSARRSR